VFIAETEGEAKAWARTAHPEDDGLVIRVMPLEHEMSANENPVPLEIVTDLEEIALRCRTSPPRRARGAGT
jgi:hypothetical protein